MAFYPKLFGTGECIECKSMFYKSAYRQKVCKSCRPEYRKRKNLDRWYAWYKNNKEKAALNSRNWFNKNREVLSKRYAPIHKKWREDNSERMRILKKAAASRRGLAGTISAALIQKVYESNISKFGCLTCILCFKPIEFGKDSLEHKNPISRGGVNEFDNLGVSHLLCNMKKNKKTVEEYHEYIGVTK